MTCFICKKNFNTLDPMDSIIKAKVGEETVYVHSHHKGVKELLVNEDK